MGRTSFMAAVSLVCSAAGAGPAIAQTSVIESYLEEQAERSEQSELFELMEQLRGEPVNINRASISALQLVPGITKKLAQDIVAYRAKSGRFASTDDLVTAQILEPVQFEEIRKFITIKEKHERAKSHRPSVRMRSRFSRQLIEPVGFTNGNYLHTPPKLYNRVQLSLSDKLHAGALIEKDSGERAINDLSLFYLSANLSEKLSIMVGNYLITAGQGLVLWGPYGLSKGSETIYTIRKRDRGVRGYLTVDENASLFGSAFTLRHGAVDLTGFVSRQKLDGTPLSEDAVSGISESGLHRTASEIAKKDLITENALGGRLKFHTTRQLDIGASVIASSYDKEFANRDLARSQFAFRGNRNMVLGLDWNYSFRAVEVFGETAYSRNGGRAVVIGSYFSANKLDLAFLHRNFAKDFQNPRAFGFGDSNGTTQNERGYYSGLRYKIARNLSLRCYYDFFVHPWRTFFEPLPFDGRDFLVQTDFRVSKRLQLTIRYRVKSKEETEGYLDDFDRSKKEFVENTRSQYRVQADYRHNAQLMTRTRVEYVNFETMPLGSHVLARQENGLTFYQDLKLQPHSSLRVEARWTYFSTESFASRVFQYENDLPGVITNRALFGVGSRWYILLKYRTAGVVELNVKYSETSRRDVDEIGSGLDRIAGNIDKRIAIQLEAKL